MKQDEIKYYLPAVFQRTLPKENESPVPGGNPLATILSVMEMLHAPSEKILGEVDRFFDARRTPDEFVPSLAQWVNVDRIFAANVTLELDSPLLPKIGYLRELVANATYLSQWRGTKKGLLLFLQTATGAKDFEIEERVKGDDGQTKPFYLKIRAPKSTEAQAELIRRIIESEKPVHLTYDIEFV
jgi:phage tail-like protein